MLWIWIVMLYLYNSFKSWSIYSALQKRIKDKILTEAKAFNLTFSYMYIFTYWWCSVNEYTKFSINIFKRLKKQTETSSSVSLIDIYLKYDTNSQDVRPYFMTKETILILPLWICHTLLLVQNIYHKCSRVWSLYFATRTIRSSLQFVFRLFTTSSYSEY
jgi:hypothetical protein